MIKLLQVGDINRQMWQQVNKHKSILPYPHQISFMVDRTVEHFKVQLQKKMKKKAQEAAKAAAASGSGTGGGTPREVRNLPKPKRATMYALSIQLSLSRNLGNIFGGETGRSDAADRARG